MERQDAYTVRDAAADFDAAIVSSIRTYGNLGPYRPLDRAEFKGIRIFDLLLRHPQIVCGSSVKAGDPDNSLYGNWGVVLADGNIEQAYPYDAISYASDNKAYSPYAWRIDGTPVKQQMSEAIEYRMGHNEIDVRIGANAIAGIYFGAAHEAEDGVDLPSKSIVDLISDIGVPIYSLQDGRFFTANTEGSSRPVSPSEIVQHHVTLADDHASRMKQVLAQKLFLPSRNSISAGQQFGKSYQRSPSRRAKTILERSAEHPSVDHRYFGSMAIYSAGLTSLFPKAVFSKDEYYSFTKRLMPNGMLSTSLEDIEYYIATGEAPEQYGRI